jgi:HPt (histidine-containing phosphotransfer) domain-containing protein
VDEKTRALYFLNTAEIEGVDLNAGVARFGGQPKLYLKIVGTFTKNIGAHIDALNELVQDEANIAEYAVKVHGVKGSCYGIDALKVGKMAEGLEFAAKAGNYDEIVSGNGALADAVNELVPKLEDLVQRAQEDGSGKAKKPEPQKELLATLFNAAGEFDVDAISAAITELEKYDYDKNGALVAWLSGKANNFAYDEIREKLKDLI